MTHPAPIDLEQWPRREHFDHYRNRVGCTYAITVDIDVTEMVAALRETTKKTYLAQVWALAAIVNRHEEFRMTLDEDGHPAVWDMTHPSFTVFNPARETFASVWSPFDSDFSTFHDSASEVLLRYKDATCLFPQTNTPENTFDVSSLPWTSFTGFTLNIRDSWDHLPPVFTLGRYREKAGRVKLPLAVQVHHAAADGFHTSRLITELQQLVASPSWITE